MTLHFLPPARDPYESAVEDAIATCNGDLRGALRALIIANEFLERDLEKALGSMMHDGNIGIRPALDQVINFAKVTLKGG